MKSTRRSFLSLFAAAPAALAAQAVAEAPARRRSYDIVVPLDGRYLLVEEYPDLHRSLGAMAQMHPTDRHDNRAYFQLPNVQTWAAPGPAQLRGGFTLDELAAPAPPSHSHTISAIPPIGAIREIEYVIVAKPGGPFPVGVITTRWK